MTASIERLRLYARLMRLHRPIGIYLLLWPTLWALWIAGEGHPNPGVVAIFVLGVTLMRSAGCVVNDYADRHFDPHVARTQDRPIAAGRVRPREALTLFVVLCVLAFGLVLLTNPLTILLSVMGAFLAATYPFMKRITHLPQIYLGVAFAWAVPMAFAAQTGSVPGVAWLLFFAPIFWATAYDTMYAMVDRDDDLKIGVKSTAILFGQWDWIMVGLFQGLFLMTLFMAGLVVERGPYYFGGLLVAAALALYQQRLIATREPGKCFAAFLNNSWLGAVVFLGIALDYLLAP